MNGMTNQVAEQAYASVFVTGSSVAAAWQSWVAPLSQTLCIGTHVRPAKRACRSDPLRPIMPNASPRLGTPRRGMPCRCMPRQLSVPATLAG